MTTTAMANADVFDGTPKARNRVVARRTERQIKTGFTRPKTTTRAATSNWNNANNSNTKGSKQ